MLTEPLYQGLQDLGLRGMARQFSAQEKGTSQDLNFGERLALLIDAEQSERRNYRMRNGYAGPSSARPPAWRTSTRAHRAEWIARSSRNSAR